LIGAMSDFSGSVFVISSNEETVMKRRPGLVGLYFFRATSWFLSEHPCGKWQHLRHQT
jgi:hypothetical protein